MIKVPLKDTCLLELYVFRRVSHPRVVPLLGYCLEYESERFLIYKYMLNGDLATYLQNIKGRWRQFTIIGLDNKIDDSYNLQELWGPTLSSQVIQGLLISYSPVKNTKILLQYLYWATYGGVLLDLGI